MGALFSRSSSETVELTKLRETHAASRETIARLEAELERQTKAHATLTAVNEALRAKTCDAETASAVERVTAEHDAAMTSLRARLAEAEAMPSKKCKESIARLMASRDELTARAKTLRVKLSEATDNCKSARKRQQERHTAVVHELREKRPIVLDHLNNTSQEVELCSRALAIRIANVSVDENAQAVVRAIMRMPDRTTRIHSVTFRGDRRVKVLETEGTVRVSRARFTTNGTTLLFPRVPEGGMYLKVVVAVTGDNTLGGLHGIQLRAPPAKQRLMLPSALKRRIERARGVMESTRPQDRTRAGGLPTGMAMLPTRANPSARR